MEQIQKLFRKRHKEKKEIEKDLAVATRKEDLVRKVYSNILRTRKFSDSDIRIMGNNKEFYDGRGFLLNTGFPPYFSYVFPLLERPNSFGKKIRELWKYTGQKSIIPGKAKYTDNQKDLILICMEGFIEDIKEKFSKRKMNKEEYEHIESIPAKKLFEEIILKYSSQADRERFGIKFY